MPKFNVPQKPADSIMSKVQPMQAIFDLGPVQSKNMKVTRDFQARQRTYRTVKDIYERHPKSKMARIRAFQEQMCAEVADESMQKIPIDLISRDDESIEIEAHSECIDMLASNDYNVEQQKLT